MMIWLIFSLGSLHRKLHMGSTAADSRALNILEVCKAKMGINKNTSIPLIIQNVITAPSLFGILPPRILLPPAAIQLDDKDLAYVIMHELAHYKRKDIPVNYLLLILQTVHWFNLVIWYCFRRIRQDMELASDESVLSVLNNTEYKDYGRALLAVLKDVVPPKPKPAPELLSMADGKKNIEYRLKKIIKAGFSKRSGKLALVPSRTFQQDSNKQSLYYPRPQF